MGNIDVDQFLEIVQPALVSGDADTLARRVACRWKPRTICKLLRHADVDVRRIAAITLGLIGDQACVGCLARALHDEDAQVNEMAEHGLWSIWFRTCKPDAALPFEQGVAHLADESYEPALEHFQQAIHIDPAFAEAYDQAGMVRFLLGQWDQSVADFQQALTLQPAHFGAMGGMGHAYTHLGDMHSALTCYRRAIAINPRMPAITRAIERLERQLKPVHEYNYEPFPHTISPDSLPLSFRTN